MQSQYEIKYNQKVVVIILPALHYTKAIVKFNSFHLIIIIGLDLGIY